MIVSIHQPDFMPWLGLFNRISNSDRFVIFDNVLAPQGKSWLTRNQIVLNGAARWLSLPVNKSSGTYICDQQIANAAAFKKKHLGTLRQAYGKSEYFSVVFELIEQVYQYETQLAADFNYRILQSILECLDISVEVVWATQLLSREESAELRGNDMVLELAKRAGATTYISGTGCTDFILPSTFEEQKISFRFQEFSHPTYEQVGAQEEFISHMSVVDSLFNIGPERVAQIVKKDCI